MAQLIDMAGPGPLPMTLWFNPLSPYHSLRVTDEGKKWIMGSCDLPIYHFKLAEKINNQQLLQLDHLIASPYYIRSRNFLELFGEDDAIMLSLHSGNLAQYLQTLALD